MILDSLVAENIAPCFLPGARFPPGSVLPDGAQFNFVGGCCMDARGSLLCRWTLHVGRAVSAASKRARTQLGTVTKPCAPTLLLTCLSVTCPPSAMPLQTNLPPSATLMQERHRGSVHVFWTGFKLFQISLRDEDSGEIVSHHGTICALMDDLNRRGNNSFAADEDVQSEMRAAVARILQEGAPSQGSA